MSQARRKPPCAHTTPILVFQAAAPEPQAKPEPAAAQAPPAQAPAAAPSTGGDEPAQLLRKDSFSKKKGRLRRKRPGSLHVETVQGVLGQTPPVSGDEEDSGTANEDQDEDHLAVPGGIVAADSVPSSANKIKQGRGSMMSHYGDYNAEAGFFRVSGPLWLREGGGGGGGGVKGRGGKSEASTSAEVVADSTVSRCTTLLAQDQFFHEIIDTEEQATVADQTSPSTDEPEAAGYDEYGGYYDEYGGEWPAAAGGMDVDCLSSASAATLAHPLSESASFC